MFKKIFMISVIGAFAALGGCSGDDGSPGAPGAIGPAGPQGEAGPQGIAGTDAGASFDLTILHLNDTHSNITGDDFDYDFDFSDHYFHRLGRAEYVHPVPTRRR